MTVGDVYAVLGVPKDASDAQIRRAYRSKSLALHPDKNPGSSTAAAAFSELVSAYGILSNADRRAEYDREANGVYVAKGKDDPFADAAYRQAFAASLAETLGREGAGVDQNDVFESLFGKTRAGMGHTPSSPTSPNTHSDAASDLGGGAGAGAGADTGAHAGSRGSTGAGGRSFSRAERASLTQDELRAAAAAAEKEGMWKPPDHEVDLPLTLTEMYTGCVKRRRLRKQVLDPATNSFSEHAEILNIHVRPGYRPGDKIRFHEASDHGHGIIPADVVFIVTALPHPRFALVDGTCDLRVDVTLGLADALAGALIRIDPLVGDAFSVRTNDVVQPGHVRRVRGRGMPRPPQPGTSAANAAAVPAAQPPPGKRGDAYGDLLLRFNVVFPPSLNSQEKVRVREILSAVEDRTGLGSPTAVAPADGAQEMPTGSMRRASSLFNASATKRTRSTHHVPVSPDPRSGPNSPAASVGSSQKLRQQQPQSPRSSVAKSSSRGSVTRRKAEDPMEGPSTSSPRRMAQVGDTRRPVRTDAGVVPRRATPVLDPGSSADSSAGSSAGSTQFGRSATTQGGLREKRESVETSATVHIVRSSQKTTSRRFLAGAESDDDDDVVSIVNRSQRPVKKKGFLASLGLSL